MSDLFSSLLIFTIIKTILSTCFYCFKILQKSCKMSVDRNRVEYSGNDNSGQRMMRTNSRTIREILSPRTTLIYIYRSAILSSKSSSSKLFKSLPVVRSASQLYSSSCASQCLSSLLSKLLVVFALITLSGRLFQIVSSLCNDGKVHVVFLMISE